MYILILARDRVTVHFFFIDALLFSVFGHI